MSIGVIAKGVLLSWLRLSISPLVAARSARIHTDEDGDGLDQRRYMIRWGRGALTAAEALHQPGSILHGRSPSGCLFR